MIFDYFKKAIFGEPAESPLGAQTVVNFGQPVWKMGGEERFKTFLKEAYEKNEIVCGSLNLIATTFCQAPLTVVREDNEREVIPNHPVQLLFDHINPQMDYVEFFNTIVLHLYLGGNAYIEKVRDRRGRVTEVWPLRPDRVRVVTDEFGFINQYEYQISGKTFRKDANDIVHIKFPNPGSIYYGFSPLWSLAAQIDIDNESNSHAKVTLQNHGAPSQILKLPYEVQADEARRIKSEWKRQFSNGGRGNLLVLGGMDKDVEMMNSAQSLKDMDFSALRLVSETRVLSTLRIPPQVYGAFSGQQSSTYDNYATALKQFWRQTIIPLQQRIASILSHDPDLGKGMDIIFDVSDVEALTEDRQIKFSRAITGYQAGLLTLNEARFEINMNPLSEGDQRLNDVTESVESVDTAADMVVDNQLTPKSVINKAISDVDTKPTDGMVEEAKKGLEWRKEHGRGGTAIGVARANQIINRENLSPSTIKRMHSYFSRHEVDKEAEGFSPGEEGFPSAGRIAWALWGGDAGQSWAARKVEEIERAQEKSIELKPLIEGPEACTPEGMSRNIGELIASGHSPEQAAAIAHETCNESKKEIAEEVKQLPTDPELDKMKRNLAIALGRMGIADKSLHSFHKETSTVFSSIIKEAKQIINVVRRKSIQNKQNELTDIQLLEIEKAIEEARRHWEELFLSQVGPVMQNIMEEAGEDAAVQVGVSFNIDDPRVRDAMKLEAFKFAQKVTDTSVDELKKTLAASRAEGLSINETARRIGGLSDSWNNVRALQIAKTETARASNTGALNAYKQANIELVEWSAILDSTVCPYCRGLDGKTTPTGESFVEGEFTPVREDGSLAPPLNLSYTDGVLPSAPAHPSCRCVIIPVI